MLNGIKHRIKKRNLDGLLFNKFYFSKNGYCQCCQNPTEFISYHSWLRDSFLCAKCNSKPRHRALLRVLQKYFPNWRTLMIHESSPSRGGASERLRSDCKNYISSQYYPQQPFGQFIAGHRNENLELQTFQDCSFDIVITQDVFEHIYNPTNAFRVIARTLKPGGAHIFSVPLINKHNPSQVWATKNADGSPKFLYKPEYYGNPIDPNGSPVTWHWGYDIVDFIAKVSGLSTIIEYIDDLEFGIRAEYNEILVTHKLDEMFPSYTM